MAKKNISFTEFVPEFLDQMQTTTDKYLDEYSIHQAFVYFIAELFETTDSEIFRFTDGANDGGVDFFIQDMQSYIIYQCKTPTEETLTLAKAQTTYNKNDIQELLSAIEILRDAEGKYKIKAEVARMRSDLHRDLASGSEDVEITAVLALNGDLTAPALKFFEAQKELLSKSKVTLKLINWRDVYNKLHEVDVSKSQTMRIDLHCDDVEKESVRHQDYCYMLSYGADFYDAWRNHEWALFDWNVRLQLSRSKINKRIVSSLSKSKTRKIFHHLNNGILITCKKYSFKNGGKEIHIEDPQIINGCQTVCAIRDAYESLNPREQADFREKVRVQVKIIQKATPDEISQMVIATNDQNPMSIRNLKSNSSEQKEIQNLFSKISTPWFYQRKDGEWVSLLSSSSTIRGFRPSDYAYSSKKYRVIDNGILAKIWYSWIGYSERVVRGGFDYFEDGNKEVEVYDRIFKSIPNDSFWDDFSKSAFFTPKNEHFDSRIPSVHQYLLAYSVKEFIGYKRISWKENRDQALARGAEQGVLFKDPKSNEFSNSPQEINEYLLQDVTYRQNILINNMTDIIVELFCFALAIKYGDLSLSKSKKILETEQINKYVTSALQKDSAPSDTQDGNSIFGPIYAFIVYSIKQYFFENRAEILSAPRLKAYLFQRNVVNRLRATMLAANKQIVDYSQPWKPQGVAFFDSLPNL